MALSLPTALGPWSCRVWPVFARRPHYVAVGVSGRLLARQRHQGSVPWSHKKAPGPHAPVTRPAAPWCYNWGEGLRTGAIGGGRPREDRDRHSVAILLKND